MSWAKNLVKRVLRPFAKPVIVRLQAQQQQIDQIAQHLPLLLNAIATQNAAAREFERYRANLSARLDDHEARLRPVTDELAPRLDDHEAQLARVTEEITPRLDDHEARLVALAETLSYLDHRAEFIRREVMYETRYGAGSPGVGQVEPRDVDLEKLSAKGPLRLNLGSGHVPKTGYVNVDARDLDGVDVVADVRRLPFEPGTIEEIYASHLIEHFPIEELRRVVLPHWLGLLRPGGRLVAVTPDADAMVKEAAAGRMPFEDLQRVTFGDQEYDGDFHFAMFTPDSFSGLLAEAGFATVHIVERARRNGLCYEFEIIGERPSGEG